MYNFMRIKKYRPTTRPIMQVNRMSYLLLFIFTTVGINLNKGKNSTTYSNGLFAGLFSMNYFQWIISNGLFAGLFSMGCF